MIKRALISVSDKTNIVEFAEKLVKNNIEILSTGGTYKLLADNGIAVTKVSDVTEFPECLDGRVKTLHPKIHGGILGVRDNEDHLRQMKELGIEGIDLVVINLYPFKNTVLKPDVTMEDAIENIDIGGPTMLRSAAKNHKFVTVVVDTADYERVAEEIEADGDTSAGTKYKCALKVFEHTAAYDALISDYLRKNLEEDYVSEKLTLTYEKAYDLRYGENPHQKATFYKEIGNFEGTLVNAEQLHGKELSFNNINDANGALDALKEFTEPTAVAVKHTNACGIGTGTDICEAYKNAYACDPISIFGGILALNRSVDMKTAEEISKIYCEIILAPDYDSDALELLMKKKNMRIMKIENILEKTPSFDIKKVRGGILIQDTNDSLNSKLEVVTEKQPTEKEMADMLFALKAVKHIKSNGIVLAKDNQTLALGPGQVNRIWAVENCIKQTNSSLEGAVMASDAFFPFRDCVDAAAKAGITAIIQPGGSMRDQESIDACNELGIAMVFTGLRHFKH